MTIKFCKKCQCDTERLISGGRCKPCNKANNDAYKLANADKLKAYAAARRKANPQKHMASVKAAQIANSEKFALYEAFYLANNPKT